MLHAGLSLQIFKKWASDEKNMVRLLHLHYGTMKLMIMVITRVVQKVVNANPGLKVNRRVVFSAIQIFFTAYVLCSLRLFKPKTDEETI